MSRLEYLRTDLRISVRRADDGRLVLRVAGQDIAVGRRLSAQTADRLLRDKTGRRLERLLIREQPSFRDFVDMSPSPPVNAGGTPIERRKRIVLDIDAPPFAILDWERALSHLDLPDEIIIVRGTHVRQTGGEGAVALPLRFVQVDPVPGRDLPATIRRLFASRSEGEVAQAVQMTTCPSSVVAQGHGPEGWPKVDILHFDDVLVPRDPAAMLALTDPRRIGTLGWLSRLTSSLQTRLVVLNCSTSDEASALYGLATALIRRGGPAVVVSQGGREDPDYYQAFYDRLIHDDPLDVAVKDSIGRYDRHSRAVLFAGGGREEGVRPSASGLELVVLTDALGQKDTVSPATVAWKHPELTKLWIDLAGPLPARKNLPVDLIVPGTRIMESLGPFAARWANWTFNLRERDGLSPMAEELAAVREKLVLAPRRRPEIVESRRRAARRRSKRRRHVNALFWQETLAGTIQTIDQKEARLELGERVHLGVQIGTQDMLAQTVGSTVLNEEVFKWRKETKGVWLEVAVTGIDFEVEGDPVRDLWLPRDADSDLLTFPVTPRQKGASALRVTLYCRQHVLMSLRLAALVYREEEPIPSPARQRVRLARALGVAKSDVDDVGYLPRVEYSEEPNLDQADRLPGRVLGIVANHVNGKPTVSIKGSEGFSARINRNLPKIVEAVRKTFDEIATGHIDVNDGSPDAFYRFANSDNSGSNERLRVALFKLAHAGSRLYDAVVPVGDTDLRKRFREALEAKPGQTIGVAHVLLENVIPWAAIYDRPFDPYPLSPASDLDGKDLVDRVCLAALPNRGGGQEATRCEDHFNCPLYPNHAAQTAPDGGTPITKNQVVCPRHFWGFQHIIELPPHEVDKSNPIERERRDRVGPSDPPHLTIGYNGGLDSSSKHLSRIETVLSDPGTTAQLSGQSADRQQILKDLKNEDLDVVYFFCHARGGSADPTDDTSRLEVQVGPADQAREIMIYTLDETYRWPRHPLVILNGCSTAAFSPDALAPFVRKFVNDIGAAGMVGTEVPVWEPLATEFAEQYLQMFLSGRPAGQSLLDVRQHFLSKGNPLGLIYTLFALSELALDRGAPREDAR
ncbi:MAG: CHAT domain-containing protein [Pseudomonadota bacterium]|nr:CHAT domain-containing protein [Pseudomonadota bacterium]